MMRPSDAFEEAAKEKFQDFDTICEAVPEIQFLKKRAQRIPRFPNASLDPAHHFMENKEEPHTWGFKHVLKECVGWFAWDQEDQIMRTSHVYNLCHKGIWNTLDAVCLELAKAEAMDVDSASNPNRYFMEFSDTGLFVRKGYVRSRSKDRLELRILNDNDAGRICWVEASPLVVKNFVFYETIKAMIEDFRLYLGHPSYDPEDFYQRRLSG